MIVTPEQSTHWYTPDGEPRYGATLREARKEALYPSVTTILSIVAQPGLEAWKQTQMIEAALTLPRRDGEPMDVFAKRVAEDGREHGRRSAEVGSAVHDAIEAYVKRGELVSVSGFGSVLSQARQWLDEHIDLPASFAEVSAANPEAGYAGRIDLVGYDKIGTPIVVDFKTQNVKHRPRQYKKWLYQGAAYLHMDVPDVRLTEDARFGNLVISTNQDVPGMWWMEATEDELHEAWVAFQSAFAVWRFEKGYDPLEAA